MVTLHRQPQTATRPTSRRRSCPTTRTPVCLWPGCGARLATDHDRPVCDCHVAPGYNPRHDPRVHALVRHLVVAAYPEAVDLCAVLKATSRQVQDVVRYLNRRPESLGGVIVGARRGYVLELGEVAVRPRRLRSKVKA